MFYQAGNTVRFTAVFKDFNGQTVDPPIVRFKFYDETYTPLVDQSISPTQKTEDGKYYFDQITPAPGVYFYEWYAEIGGLPSLKRASITSVKV